MKLRILEVWKEESEFERRGKHRRRSGSSATSTQTTSFTSIPKEEMLIAAEGHIQRTIEAQLDVFR
jgi:hypothetical protein